MREIKFRQPILFDGDFHHWHYWGFIGGVFIGAASLKAPNYQYTGLKDKTGKEIYEGDIAEIHSETPLVKWSLNGFCWIIEWKNKVATALSEFIPSQIEVIGNIHENPELLEQGD